MWKCCLLPDFHDKLVNVLHVESISNVMYLIYSMFLYCSCGVLKRTQFLDF